MHMQEYQILFKCICINACAMCAHAKKRMAESFQHAHLYTCLRMHNTACHIHLHTCLHMLAHAQKRMPSKLTHILAHAQQSMLHTHPHTRTNTQTHTVRHIQRHAHRQTCIHTHTHTLSLSLSLTHAHTHIRTHTHTHTHNQQYTTHPRTCIGTYACKLERVHKVTHARKYIRARIFTHLHDRKDRNSEVKEVANNRHVRRSTSLNASVILPKVPGPVRNLHGIERNNTRGEKDQINVFLRPPAVADCPGAPWVCQDRCSAQNAIYTVSNSESA
jgi:hypothetical protein